MSFCSDPQELIDELWMSLAMMAGGLSMARNAASIRQDRLSRSLAMRMRIEAASKTRRCKRRQAVGNFNCPKRSILKY